MVVHGPREGGGREEERELIFWDSYYVSNNCPKYNSLHGLSISFKSRDKPVGWVVILIAFYKCIY